MTLTATNASGSNSVSKVVVVAAGTPPVADFEFTVAASGNQVNFVDRSTGSPTNWFWQFGDNANTTSNLRNPTFTYPVDGTYTVTLTVTNANGSNSKSKVVTVPAPTTTP